MTIKHSPNCNFYLGGCIVNGTIHMIHCKPEIFMSCSLVLIESGSVFRKSIVFLAYGDNQTFCLDTFGTLHALDNSTKTPVIFNSGSLFDKKIVSVSCGHNQTFCVDTSGTLHAWGDNFSTIDPFIMCYGSLVNKKIVFVTCGFHHTMVVDSNGTLHAWGNNPRCALDDKSSVHKYIPFIVNNGSLLGKTIVSVACGATHTVALDTTGALHQLRLNDDDDDRDDTGGNKYKYKPFIVNCGSLIGKKIVSVACGNAHTIAVDTNGILHTWGRDRSNQQGDTSIIAKPVAVNLRLIKTIVSVTCGAFYTIALDTSGKLHAWGQFITHSTSVLNANDKYQIDGSEQLKMQIAELEKKNRALEIKVADMIHAHGSSIEKMRLSSF